MIYYSDEHVLIRPMKEVDIQSFVKGFKDQGWVKSPELFTYYLKKQEINKLKVLVAEVNNEVSGYVVLYPHAFKGPFANKGIPEIVDLNVLINYQKSGIGNKLMDIAELLAKERSKIVSLAVGIHYGYGPAQRMYVKRGYIPDGSGVWYQGERLEQYVKCVNDDDLVLYLLKDLADISEQVKNFNEKI